MGRHGGGHGGRNTTKVRRQGMNAVQGKRWQNGRTLEELQGAVGSESKQTLARLKKEVCAESHGAGG